MTASPSEDGIPDEAFAVLSDWLPANDDHSRPLISLATVDADGRPDARSVLLSEFDRSGFFVHTDSRSRKVADIEAHPEVAFSVAWPADLRQLTVQGVARRASPDEEAASYARRSRYLQLLAWLNTPEFALFPTGEQEDKWAAFEAAHPDGTLAAPDTWLGFVIEPTRLTFWEGNPRAASRRTEYRRATDATWSRAILPG
ncbi:pyridoxamine 5'-phosphate oxidase family protein [Agreia pratensis]|uniref:pyridoxine/pyridoxamine 5'-phosphate oxidase n=1 Tax=Agreia pratensis TaxID=150121 RepID=UPI00188A6E24|nr:pyridoxamine 5'-phosphate oxidase family protein [Agreia pratensis]MBF4633535.1 pyridoxamine 5'-phosphate oxidase family protein [Agreia pratensis]